ncbi:hydroxyacid dehydrogenase [Haloactinopolyspora alba]|uniref:hydroxyacid dehydrogenase n=1 Tax=Haloactinopolyspora alba TaxID=648780 RepID=UPI00197A7E37|nr:hydroxyacid dehydrogenase [Haloactinopolyspora alba]
MQRSDEISPSQGWSAVLCVAEPERGAFFPASTLQRLEARCDVRIVDRQVLDSAHGFAQSFDGVQIAITSWGFPSLSAERLVLAPQLRLVTHTGSSVKFLVTDEFWTSGVRISQAGAAMAASVAELSLAFTLALLRRIPEQDHALHDGSEWQVARTARRGVEIAGARVGVVGASRTGRSYVERCQALGADVLVHDPYLRHDDPLSDRSATLESLLASCDVVAIHAPLTEESKGMLGRGQLASIRDGGVVVNTARSPLVDMDALYDEAASGRLDVALDVFDVEPLPPDDRWRALPNVLLTPHLGGASVQSRLRAGQIVVSEIERFISGRALEHEVHRPALERIG